MGKPKAKPKQDSAAWRNRIIGSAMVPASELLANPANWRVHPKAQQEALAGAIGAIGWIQEVIVNQTTGHVVDGHLRVSLALRQGDDTPVPVKYVDLSESEEQLALATIDPLSAMAVADKEQLDALLRETQTGSEALADLLNSLVDMTSLSEVGAPGDNHRELTQQIACIIALSDVTLFESAMQKADKGSRAEALDEICRSYLAKG